MKATQLLHQKITLKHEDGIRTAILEIVVWQVSASKDYPEGLKFRAWFSENGQTIFGLDNHKPKGPHLHVREVEVGYVFRGLDALMEDVVAMIKKDGFEI
jgi:hypothetical protein